MSKPPAATVPPKSIPAADVDGGSIRTNNREAVTINDLGNLKEDKGGLILQAAKAKDLAKIKAELEAGSNINQAHTDGDLVCIV
ncbi:hypothetical protein SARC_10520 [Sphaeroforma arctica JP610]|uniref:Uncharacterized protein n=1 Tax=Sphaeroforma arctica JP610 TaxID=667725 RepID=A0A0L0FJQ1_9EUKA|nr:hypothetical protein SARC_10520 [Sphaeroforma arctica JP610]KNC77007.1 hypothetical protein SARC_10520 [Sphaeroforma arctica JP610]|eukprot:XP_014150909.1 hypothetical protein SARC_10520 [Sphaeroforma arctica JP610]